MLPRAEWDAVNTLLSFMRSAKVVDLVNNYYKPYDNDAPGKLMAQQIDIVQRYLDQGIKDY